MRTERYSEKRVRYVEWEEQRVGYEVVEKDEKGEVTEELVQAVSRRAYWPLKTELLLGGVSALPLIGIMLKTHYSALKVLDLSSTPVDEATLAVVTGNDSIRKTLTSLDLSKCLGLRREDLRQFLQASRWTVLQQLYLDHTQLDDDGLTQLARNSHLQTLKHLSLAHCGNLIDTGITTLLDSRKSVLGVLDVSFNRLDQHFLSKLRKKGHFLTQLRICNCTLQGFDELDVIRDANLRTKQIVMKFDGPAYARLLSTSYHHYPRPNTRQPTRSP